MEVPHPKAPAEPGDRGPEDGAVHAARPGAMREREHHGREDPEIVLDVDRPLRHLAELAADLPDIAPARELGGARTDRVQPEHATRLGELAQHMVVGRGIFVPVLGEGDDSWPRQARQR